MRQVPGAPRRGWRESGCLSQTPERNVPINMIIMGRQLSHEWKQKLKNSNKRTNPKLFPDKIIHLLKLQSQNWTHWESDYSSAIFSVSGLHYQLSQNFPPKSGAVSDKSWPCTAPCSYHTTQSWHEEFLCVINVNFSPFLWAFSVAFIYSLLPPSSSQMHKT